MFSSTLFLIQIQKLMLIKKKCKRNFPYNVKNRRPQRSSQGGFFLLGKKEKVKPRSVRKEHYTSIPVHHIESGTVRLTSEWDTSNNQANIQFPCSLHIINERKKKKIHLCCMWNFIILLAKARQSFLG